MIFRIYVLLFMKQQFQLFVLNFQFYKELFLRFFIPIYNNYELIRRDERNYS